MDITERNSNLSDAEGNILDREVALLAAIKNRVEGNPNCRRANCYGRGFIGILAVRTKSGEPALKLLLCDCATVGKSPFAILEQKLETSTKQITDLTSLIAKEFDRQHQTIYVHTTFGGIRTAWRFIASKLKPKAKKAAAKQSHPSPEAAP